MAASRKRKQNKAAEHKTADSAAAVNNIEEPAAPAVPENGVPAGDVNTAPAEADNAASAEAESAAPSEMVKNEDPVKPDAPEMPETQDNAAEPENNPVGEEKNTAPEAEPAKESDKTGKPSEVVNPAAESSPAVTAPVKTETEKRVIKSSVQYSKSAEREKNIRKQVKKRKRRPVLLILFLCSMLVLVAIVYNSITLEPETVEEESEPIDVPVTEIITPTPGPNDPQPEETSETGQEAENPEETAEPAVEPTPEPVVEHSYQFFVEDISWEEARARCLELGGYLAVITSPEELEEIISMAENNGVTHVWLGCHRVDGELVWEYGGDYYYQWDSGEPSAYDYNDDVAEDYLMFWEHNGGWYYNDSRNDPCGDYAAFYSGDMGYVCEFGSN